MAETTTIDPGPGEAPTLEQLETGISQPSTGVSVEESLAAAIAAQDAGEGGDEDATAEADATDTETEAADGDDAADGEATGDGEGEAEGQGEPQPLEPLPEWSAKDHEAFRALDPEAQKFVLDHAGADNERLQAAEATAKKYETFDGLLAEHRDKWAQNGLDDVGGIRQLLATWQFAANEPQKFIAWFAQNSGIALPSADNAGEDTGVDLEILDPDVRPFVENLMSQNKAMSDRLEKIDATLQKQTTSQTTNQEAEADRRIAEFKDAKSEDGKPAHPYFDQVRSYMSGIMISAANDGVELSIEDAYDQACRAHPEVSAKIDAERKALADQKTAKQTREKAAKAKKASSSVSGDKGAGAESRPASTGSTYDDVAATMADMGMV